ncbi:MAG: alpha/beta fold hydrolase [Thermomicrobiales bacterium]
MRIPAGQVRLNRRRAVAGAAVLVAGRSPPVVAGQSAWSNPTMIDVGGRHLAVSCLGAGTPPVLLEAGLTATGLTWRRAQVGIATFTRACAYDRANLGHSDPAPGPRTGIDAANDLRSLLQDAGIPAPYVLVGASFGGFVVRLFAAAHPDAVAGVVLVDASHEDQVARLAELLTEEQLADLSFDVPRNIEEMDVKATWDEVRAAGSLPDVPLIVLSAGLDKPAPPGYPAAEMNQIWRDLQADLATLSPDSLHLVIETDHDIALERPAVVVDAVRRVAEAVWTETPLATPAPVSPRR